MSDNLMNEIKRAAVGDGKYVGLPSHVYSLFGDALAKLDEVAALEADNKEADRLLLAAAMKYTGLEARLSKMEEALRDLVADYEEIGGPTFYDDAFKQAQKALASQEEA